MDFNAGLGMPRSYYAATAHPATAFPRLRGEVQADLVVMGGGCTGLSAALHAAGRGPCSTWRWRPAPWCWS